MPTESGHTSAIRATKVCGTPVHDTSGRKIGELDELTRNDGHDFRTRAHDYYKAPRYWESPRH
jgi:hypothetical protein